jgi:energy-converting hydrogenase B subunit D
MDELSWIQAGLFSLAAVVGTATALIRDTRRQAMMLSLFGLVLTALFLSIKSPDVAYSELVIGSGVLPLMVLVAIAKTGGGK